MTHQQLELLLVLVRVMISMSHLQYD